MRIQAEANLEALIESTDDLVWAMDPCLLLINFNRAFKMYIESNYGTLAAPGIDLRELLPPERMALLSPLFDRALRGERFSAEFLLVNGHTLELALNPILVNGKATGVSVFGKDITDRKAAELALHEAERKYRSIFDGALEGIYQTSTDGKVLTSNLALSRMLGYDSVDEGIAKVDDTSQDLWADPEERKKYLAMLDENDAVMGFECRFRRKDGSIIWVSLNTRKICGADGKVLRREGFVTNIDERKRSEEALRESGDFLRGTQRIGDMGFYVLEVSAGRWTSTSRLDEIFGIDASYERSVAGWEALVHPADQAMMSDYFANEVIKNGKPFDKQYRIVRPSDGTERWVHGLGKLEYDAEGHPLKMRGIISDISTHRQWEMQLLKSEERYRTAFLTSIDAITLSCMEDGRLVDVNPAFLRMFGFEREEVIGRTTLELNLWPVPDHRQKLVAALRENSSCRDLEFQLFNKNRKTIWALVSGARIELDGVPCFLLVIRDISEAKAAAEALRESEDRYRIAFQTSIDAININRLSDGLYIDCNQALLDLLGYEREELIGRSTLTLEIWAEPSDRQTMVNLVLENGSCRNMEVRFRKKSGEIIWGEMSSSLMEIAGVDCVLSVTRDLSLAKAAEREILNLAFYDPLTGLPNRRHLLDRLHLAASGTPNERLQALLLIDLDNFKTLNDTLGHQTGDEFLQEIARRIPECVPEANQVFRVGGDSFIVILEDLSDAAEEAAAEAQAVGDKILTLISRPCMIRERECLSSASIGITVFGDKPYSTDEILQQTDIALYQAKAAGRATMRFFSPALQTVINARAAMEEDLRHAIKAKQFIVYFQPQVERGRLVGAEVLIRWAHPTRGLVQPGEFIRSAENSGLILPIGDWVLETACEQIAKWAGHEETADLVLAVNISALQFRQPEFTEQVLSTLERTGANPLNLKLELTESLLVDDFEEVIQKMTELKLHGLSFSLDDFGTGYSSLAYLKLLPLDELKIDRSFVRDMLMDVGSGAIARTILSLGRSMGLSVMAEGVETKEQRGFLAGLGCHSFQGFLFSRPLPLDEFEQYHRDFAKNGLF